MSESEALQCDLAALSLRDNPAEIASWRNWRPGTIRTLAEAGYLGLRESNLAFLFSTGMKVRTLEKGKDKKVWWPFGQTSLWRGDSITEKTKRVIIAEGEIDAITLIDCGIEADGQTRVVALPGASFNITDSLPLLKDKVVVLVPDIDDAGVAALRKNLELLRGTASQLYQMDIRLDDSATDVKDLTELRDAREGLTVAEIETRFQLADPVFDDPETEKQNDGLPEDADLCEFMTQEIKEPKHLLQGLFRKGQVMIISDASKTYKSWTAMEAALAISQGGTFVKWPANIGKVYYIDTELEAFDFQVRMRSIIAGGSYKPEPGEFRTLLLRGTKSEIATLVDQLSVRLAGKDIDVIVIDAIYSLLGDREENSNEDVADVGVHLFRLAKNTGAAVIFIHHFSKGSQQGKRGIEKASGAGAWGRFPDVCLAIDRHPRISATTSSRPPVPSLKRKRSWPKGRTVCGRFRMP
jgi:hypothetical protein